MNKLFASSVLPLVLVLSVWALGGCTRQSIIDDASGERSLSMVMSLKNVVPGYEGQTKLSTTVTQSDGVFRGIEQVYIIPFDTEEKVEPEDVRLGQRNVVLGNTGISRSGLVPNNNSHLFGSAVVPNRMNHVLTYGKAPDGGEDANKVSKHTYGVLNPKGISNPAVSDSISFHLEPILSSEESTEVETVADGLLEQWNVVMSLMKDSQYPSIVSIFDIAKKENQILACSYSTLNQLRSEVQSALWRIPFESQGLLDEIGTIQNAIKAFSERLTAAGGSFPEKYGVPEGAIGFWWNGKEYLRLINSVNIALVNPASYSYPPSLWYYSNSAIKTSVNDNVRNQYVQTNQWDEILGYYTDGESVTSFTQAVAIEDPLQYGVGLLELSLAAPGEEAARLINGCPLTGIIIGDQYDVDFRFLPVDGPRRHIYDNVVTGLSIGSTEGSVQTFVLQTEEGANADVHFALEFRNTTGLTRHCQQGDILPWCKFYLAGVLKLSNGAEPQASSESFNSVFSRDHKTRVTVTVEGLKSAYNTVPDLHSPQLEIGIRAEMKWTQLTPQSIVLDF